jgi:hypothetical protein
MGSGHQAAKNVGSLFLSINKLKMTIHTTSKEFSTFYLLITEQRVQKNPKAYGGGTGI